MVISPVGHVLVLAPHTDDETLGCGGLVKKLTGKGLCVNVVALSFCGNNALLGEFKGACKSLGAHGFHAFFSVRQFQRDRQKVLDEIIKFAEVLSPPSLVICPASFDVHQDHQVVHNEAVRAFKNKASIIGYAHDWNIVGPTDFRLHVELSDEELKVKSAAMDCYKSQADRPYFKDRSWLGDEKYEVIRWKC